MGTNEGGSGSRRSQGMGRPEPAKPLFFDNLAHQLHPSLQFIGCIHHLVAVVDDSRSDKNDQLRALFRVSMEAKGAPDEGYPVEYGNARASNGALFVNDPPDGNGISILDSDLRLDGFLVKGWRLNSARSWRNGRADI